MTIAPKRQASSASQKMAAGLLAFALAGWAALGPTAHAQGAGGEQLEFSFFGLSAPSGQVLQGESFSLNLNTGLASAIDPPIARHNIFCAAYSATLDADDQRSINNIAAQARRLAVRRIEILSDPDGAATERRNDGYVCANAVRLALAKQELPKDAAIDINTASGLGQPIKAQESALLESAHRVEVLLHKPR